MRPLALSLILLILGGGAMIASADMGQMPLGSVIKGFVMPQRNPDGTLQANVTGDEATVVSLSRTTITGLRVELFNSGGEKVDTVITSPNCDYWSLEHRFSSHDGVLIVRPESKITADDIEWDFKTQTGLLSHHVKVVLDKFVISQPPQS